MNSILVKQSILNTLNKYEYLQHDEEFVNQSIKSLNYVNSNKPKDLKKALNQFAYCLINKGEIKEGANYLSMLSNLLILNEIDKLKTNCSLDTKNSFNKLEVLSYTINSSLSTQFSDLFYEENKILKIKHKTYTSRADLGVLILLVLFYENSKAPFSCVDIARHAQRFHKFFPSLKDNYKLWDSKYSDGKSCLITYIRRMIYEFKDLNLLTVTTFNNKYPRYSLNKTGLHYSKSLATKFNIS
jgi:hypothetical protein